MDTGLAPDAAPSRAASERAFLGISALLFTAGVVGTIAWTRSMSAGMPMPGDKAMSMAGERMPGQSPLGAATAFMAMWIVMMAAMMLPSLVPTLSRFRRSLREADMSALGTLTALAGAGYFGVWAAFGVVAYASEGILAGAAARWLELARWAPVASGVALLLAGAVQLTTWKIRQLEHCREVPVWARQSAPARGAWQYGLDLGAHRVLCCSGFMAALLASGLMDLGLMAIAAAAITVERVVPRPERIVRITGVIFVVVGAAVIAQTASMV